MSQSMSTLPSATGESSEENGDDDANKYTGKVEILQTEVRELRSQYNGLRDTHRRLRTNIGNYSNQLNYLKREDDVEENRRTGMEQIEKQRYVFFFIIIIFLYFTIIYLLVNFILYVLTFY